MVSQIAVLRDSLRGKDRKTNDRIDQLQNEVYGKFEKLNSRVGELVGKAQEHQQAIALVNSEAGEISSTVEAKSQENKTWRARHYERLEYVRKQNDSTSQKIAELLKNELRIGKIFRFSSMLQ